MRKLFIKKNAINTKLGTSDNINSIVVNAKLFERIEHSGIRYGIKCKQTNAAAAVLLNTL